MLPSDWSTNARQRTLLVLAVLLPWRQPTPAHLSLHTQISQHSILAQRALVSRPIRREQERTRGPSNLIPRQQRSPARIIPALEVESPEPAPSQKVLPSGSPKWLCAVSPLQPSSKDSQPTDEPPDNRAFPYEKPAAFRHNEVNCGAVMGSRSGLPKSWQLPPPMAMF